MPQKEKSPKYELKKMDSLCQNEKSIEEGRRFFAKAERNRLSTSDDRNRRMYDECTRRTCV